ncbi:prostaglandin F2-alpha receptor [Protopterus annectens]|uniref:prostaglandin F2-alpha receptor n=1 Tax=Protopterus annectens TaxID=7888 RepID=UPI001CFBAB9B|nr:prostaglandin F2-alpha receptor [Protopterus annectens]XP_043941815.1 prostaglandin F2-alpha receptor [Protopterus annectens]
MPTSENNSEFLEYPKEGNLSQAACFAERKVSVIFPIIFMTVGILSNSLAIAILIKAYQRFKLKSKASFLLCASGLVITDLFGHLINGAIAVFVYAADKDWKWIDQSNVFCNIFGMCMVFFGSCPLLLGSVMAVERCIGVTKPIFHSTKMTLRHIKAMLAFVWIFAVMIALMPIIFSRPYEIQPSKTWCFFRTKNIKDWLDSFFLLLFSCLGLVSLTVSFLCNAVTGLTLIRAKIHNIHHRQGRSHHFEMITQLLAIMCVSCICWSPFLVTMARIGVSGQQDQEICKTLLLAVRMATWNQILDPWVYILLRKTVLRKLFQIARENCGMQIINFHQWELSSIKNSLRVAAISDSTSSVPETKL